MYEFFTKLDPLQTLLALGVAALYIDGRRDRQRYQEQVEKITVIYQDTLKHTTETLEKLKAEIALMAQAMGSLRKRLDD